MNLKETSCRWLPVVGWAGFLFYLSSIPNLKTSSIPDLDFLIRSFFHLLFYFIFALLWFRALKKKTRPNLYSLVFLFVFLYSLFDEIHQYFVPTRTFQAIDLLIDNLGSFLGLVWLKKFLPQAPSQIKNLAQKLGFTNHETS